jgi:DNA replication protein DnaC
MNHRFKIDKCQNEIPEMLRLCYESEVKKRGMNYNEVDIKDYLNKVSTWLLEAKKTGLFLYGSVGNGKTTMILAIKKLIEILYLGQFGVQIISSLTLSELVRNDETNFNLIKKSYLLAIDDVGCEPSTVKNYGNELSPLTDIIYYRYDKQLFTLITSNLDKKDIEIKYGVRISDRMNEMFDFIAFTNKTYRK